MLPSVCLSICLSLARLPPPSLTTDLVKPHAGAWSPCPARARASVGVGAAALPGERGQELPPQPWWVITPSPLSPRRGWALGLFSGGVQCTGSRHFPVPPSLVLHLSLQPLPLSGEREGAADPCGAQAGLGVLAPHPRAPPPAFRAPVGLFARPWGAPSPSACTSTPPSSPRCLHSRSAGAGRRVLPWGVLGGGSRGRPLAGARFRHPQ